MTMKNHPAIVSLVRLGISLDDAIALRRISLTLNKWFILECGDGDNYGSWCITRGTRLADGSFQHDDDGAPFLEWHHYLHGKGKDYTTYASRADKESGAKKRLKKIMANYPALVAYVQTDPRGCALYIIEKSRLGSNKPDECYSSFGVAVYR
jgi:hypothetical protein